MARRTQPLSDRRKTKFKHTSKPGNPRNRLIGLLAVFLVMGSGFIAVLVDLQAVRSDEFKTIGDNQRNGTREIQGRRGSIIDTSGFVLASSKSSFQVISDPKLVVDVAQTSKLLASVLEIDEPELSLLLSGSGPEDRYSLIKRSVEDSVVSEIKELKELDHNKKLLAGVFIRTEEARSYPAEELGISVVGRVDPDEKGVYGIEALFNDIMSGSAGKQEFERNNFGGSIGVGNSTLTPAREGFDVVLSLDHRLQYLAEQTLIEHCSSQRAKGATAVISDPRSGDILAMASVQEAKDGDCRVANYNKALVDSFEPGSVIKPIVAAGAIEKFGLKANSNIDVPSNVKIGGKTFHDDPFHEPAPYPLTQIMADSMNVGIILLSQRLGPKDTHFYLKEFGLSQRSELGFNGETRGSLSLPGDWWGSDAGSIPIGQGVTVNAVQINSAFNVIANAGVKKKASIVKTLRSPEGKDLIKENEINNVVISSETAAEVKKTLVAVTETGTGQNAQIPGFTVAGKTGTAWKVFDDGSGKHTYGSDNNRRYVTTFSGFVPADNPVLSITVMVDEPQKDNVASKVSAPIFSELGSAGLHLLGTVPSAAESQQQSGALVRSKPAAQAIAAQSDIITPTEIVDVSASEVG